jgi:plastocyanin
MRHRNRFALVTAVALGALASPAAGLGQDRLIATVGTNDSQVITLTHENGAVVNDIPAGTYTIEVRDRSSMHNFHLTGPGVDQETSIGAITTVNWTVTFQDNQRYRFVCDAHPTTMRGSFTTGGGPSPPPPPPPPPSRLPAVGATLYATVGPGFTISFRTRRGARITRLRPGRYVIVVRDRSSAHNFHLYGRAVNKRTRVSAVGRTRWRVTFRRGIYRYRCDPHAGRMRGSFRVR